MDYLWWVFCFLCPTFNSTLVLWASWKEMKELMCTFPNMAWLFAALIILWKVCFLFEMLYQTLERVFTFSSTTKYFRTLEAMQETFAVQMSGMDKFLVWTTENISPLVDQTSFHVFNISVNSLPFYISIPEFLPRHDTSSAAQSHLWWRPDTTNCQSSAHCCH